MNIIKISVCIISNNKTIFPATKAFFKIYFPMQQIVLFVTDQMFKRPPTIKISNLLFRFSGVINRKRKIFFSVSFLIVLDCFFVFFIYESLYTSFYFYLQQFRTKWRLTPFNASLKAARPPCGITLTSCDISLGFNVIFGKVFERPQFLSATLGQYTLLDVGYQFVKSRILKRLA